MPRPQSALAATVISRFTCIAAGSAKRSRNGSRAHAALLHRWLYALRQRAAESE